MNVFPSTLIVRNRPCLVVGDDREAKDKSRRLRKAGGVVERVSLESFKVSQIKDQFLVIFCPKDQPRLVEKVSKRCRKKRILLCAIDQPEYCDISNTAVYERGKLKVMVSTSGVSPTLARKIVEGLEQSLRDVPIEKKLNRLGNLRKRLFKSNRDPRLRRMQLMSAVEGVQFKASFLWNEKGGVKE